jgi:hypothetical protein
VRPSTETGKRLQGCQQLFTPPGNKARRLLHDQVKIDQNRLTGLVEKLASMVSDLASANELLSLLTGCRQAQRQHVEI